jgi:hypothetical protein
VRQTNAENAAEYFMANLHDVIERKRSLTAACVSAYKYQHDAGCQVVKGCSAAENALLFLAALLSALLQLTRSESRKDTCRKQLRRCAKEATHLQSFLAQHTLFITVLADVRLKPRRMRVRRTEQVIARSVHAAMRTGIFSWSDGREENI